MAVERVDVEAAAGDDGLFLLPHQGAPLPAVDPVHAKVLVDLLAARAGASRSSDKKQRSQHDFTDTS